MKYDVLVKIDDSEGAYYVPHALSVDPTQAMSCVRMLRLLGRTVRTQRSK